MVLTAYIKNTTNVSINILLDILINGGSRVSKVVGKSFRNQVEFELFEMNNKDVIHSDVTL